MSPPQRTGAFCRIPGVLGSTRPNQFLQSQRTVRESVSQLRPVPSGLRVQKSVSGGNTSVYIFSGSKVIAEYDNGAAPANPSREYIYSGGTLLAKVDSTGTYYYHQDHLSNRVVTDASGNVLAELGHFPFGESWYNGSGDKLMFTTYERDAETGNDYAQARSYANRIARFSSLDPLGGDIGEPQSLNRYSYVRSMPVMVTDPTGMKLCPPAASIPDDENRKDGDFTEYFVSEEEADPPQSQDTCSYQWGTGGGGGGFSIDGVDVTGLSGLIGFYSYLQGGNGSSAVPILTWLNLPGNFTAQNYTVYVGFPVPIPVDVTLYSITTTNVAIIQWINASGDVSAISGGFAELGGEGVGAGAGGSPSPAWAAIKAFFTVPSTAKGSCFGIFLDTTTAPMKAIQGAAKYYVPGITSVLQSAPGGAAWYVQQVNRMVEAGSAEADPELLAGVTAVGAAAGAAVPFVKAASPYALVGAVDLTSLVGLARELKAGFNGQCKW